MKLKSADIKILSEGMQAKNLILDKYGSIDEFIKQNNLNLYESSIKNYLRRKIITSDTFKYNLTVAFNKNYEDIILNEKRQLIKYVETISENIRQYKDEDDIDTLRKLKDMCLENNLHVEVGKMNRAIGMHNFYRSNLSVAAEQMQVAISIVAGRNISDLVFSYSSELALIKIYDEKYEDARKICDNIEKMLPKLEGISSDIIFLHYYRSGIAYNNLNRHQQARQIFEKSIQYASSQKEKGLTIMNIGLSYKREKKYTTAIEYYNRALEHFDPDDISSISMLYNNTAEAYKMKKDYDTALCIIEKALGLLNNSDTRQFYIAFQTYIQIKALKGETDIALNKLLNMTAKMEGTFMCKKFFISGMQQIIELGNDDKELLRQLEDVIIKFMKNTANDNDEYRDKLKLCLGDVCYRLRA